METVTIILGVVLAILMGAGAVFAIRLWDLVTQASEYFARENDRYRRAYEQQRRNP